MAQNSINVTATTGAPIKVNVTASGSQGTVTLSQDTSAYNAEIARQWAISDKMVLQEDYSSKYYANKSKESADSSQVYANSARETFDSFINDANIYTENIIAKSENAITDIETAKVDAVGNITTARDESIASVEAKGNEVVSTVNQGIADINNTVADGLTEINSTKTTILNDIEFVAEGEKDEIKELVDTGKDELKEAIGDVKVLTTLEIGDIGIAPLGIDETKGKRRYLNGQLIIQEQYVQFTEKVKSAIALYPSLACTEEEWQTAVTMSTFGACGKFVVDDNAGTIRLPKITGFIQGLTDLSQLANLVQAGLPTHTHTRGTMNITGSWMPSAGAQTGGAGGTTTGCVVSKTGTVAGDNNAYKAITMGGFSIDASKSWTGSTSTGNYSSSLQTTNTVQPEAIKYPYFIQVATGAETEDNIINEIELNNPFSLLDYKYSEYELNNLSWLRSNGQWNSKALYPAVYELLLNIYNKTITKNGVSVKLSNSSYSDTDFVLNTAEETFRLPIKVKLASGKAVVGNGMALGLMLSKSNSQQRYGLNVGDLSGASVINATTGNYGVTSGTATSGTAIPRGYATGITTDPTKSGIELSDSDLYLYFYVGETVQNANLINAGRIEEKITDVLAKPHIVETYRNGTSGYLLYSNGWCKQWGIQTGNGIYSVIKVSLLKNYKDTNYLIYGTHIAWSGTNNAWYTDQFTVGAGAVTDVAGIAGETDKTVDGFYMQSFSNHNWITEGFLAEGEY